MGLSKKHFIKVAEILNREQKNREVLNKVERITEELCNYFATENAQFDKQRFKKAVLEGVE